jgi:replication-associated recombination protein RarA
MCEIIGQDKIIRYIDDKNRDTFPRSLILLGESGCGKSLVSSYISNKLNLQIVDITGSINFDYIMSLYEKPEPYIYTIMAKDLSIKEQNAILKFVEEPLKNAYIIIEAETTNQLLPTVYNRCQVLNFLPYSKDVLSKFSLDNVLLDIARTPGQIKHLSEGNKLLEMTELANKMITKIGVANIPNMLTISDKIAWKKEKDKFDLDTFALVLNYCIKNQIKSGQNCFEFYSIIREWNIKRKAPTVIQKSLFENTLLKLKQCMLLMDNR